ncbi:hypothetical protein C9J85_17395 [Haloferax sp. wsp5]|nr:hypothetical protein C9J85_17395 [Haloferax sp. wsp5]
MPMSFSELRSRVTRARSFWNRCQNALPSLVPNTYHGIGYWWHKHHAWTCLQAVDGLVVSGFDDALRSRCAVVLPPGVELMEIRCSRRRQTCPPSGPSRL